MRNVIFIFLMSFGALMIIGSVVIGAAYWKWRRLWVTEPRQQTYAVGHVADDTLRIAFIGDSWAGLHSEMECDTMMQQQIEQLIKRPVKVVSRGKGGEVARGIYRLLWTKESVGFRQIMEQGPDYCVLSAGINDAAKCLGPNQYTEHYLLIVDFLLRSHITPVVIEVPNVDITYIHGHKPFAHKAADWLKAHMAQCQPYETDAYRRELKTKLYEKEYMDSVVYVPEKQWNITKLQDGNTKESRDWTLFQPDRIHLNHSGYQRLDNAIADAIAQRENKR